MAPLRLVPGGWLVLEMGADQRPAVEALISDSGAYDTVEFRRDYAGKERVACLRCGPTPAQK
jgi:release factor glutamine methyltransferase